MVHKEIVFLKKEMCPKERQIWDCEVEIDHFWSSTITGLFHSEDSPYRICYAAGPCEDSVNQVIAPVNCTICTGNSCSLKIVVKN